MSARTSARAKPMPRQSQAGKAAPIAVPVSPRTAWRLIGLSVGGLGAAAAIVWAIAAGLPRQATLGAVTAASEAGFVVRQVEIAGAKNQPRLSIYRELLQGGSDSMLLADLSDMRVRLLALPWVADAQIQRRWPDRLHIQITERAPAALWQWKGRLHVIDAQGVVLPTADLQPFGALPLLVGERARTQAPALLALVRSQPALADQMEAALWVGNRRWDIRMKSGETISLPEGLAAQAAFLRFADIHRETPLLGRGFVRFDMRIPDKMVVRVGGEPGQPVKPRPAPKVQAPPDNAPSTVSPAPPRAQPMQTARLPQPQAPEAVI